MRRKLDGVEGCAVIERCGVYLINKGRNRDFIEVPTIQKRPFAYPQERLRKINPLETITFIKRVFPDNLEAGREFDAVQIVVIGERVIVNLDDGRSVEFGWHNHVGRGAGESHVGDPSVFLPIPDAVVFRVRSLWGFQTDCVETLVLFERLDDVEERTVDERAAAYRFGILRDG